MSLPILITGASGFLGNSLALHFLSKEYTVHLVVRRPEAVESLTKHYSNVYLHHYDGSYSSLASLDKIPSLSICIHIAAVAAYETTSENLDKMIEANLRFGMHLLEKLRQIKCDKLINTGTYWQHYHGAEYNPVCLYAATKEAFNAIIEYYIQAYGWKVITLKLFEIYGPHDPRQKLFPTLLNAMRSKEKLLMSPGQQLLNMTYIDDVIAAYEQTMFILLNSKEQCHHQYFVSSDQNYMLKDIVNMFIQMAGESIDVQWGGCPYYSRQIMDPYIGQTIPGWKAKISLQEGMSRVLQAARIT